MTTELITEEQFKASLPKGMKRGIPPEVLADINDMISQGFEGEVFKENFMSHSQILQEGKFSMEQYVNAVKYISFRVLNNSQRRSFELVFPSKVTAWLAGGVEEKTISSYVHAYNKSKLVVRLYESTLVPFHILNQPLRQEALMVEAKLMKGAKSEMVRHMAAKTILEILAPPESSSAELSLTVKTNEHVSSLEKALTDLAISQKTLIDQGGNIKEVAESVIVNKVIEAEEGEFTEVE